MEYLLPTEEEKTFAEEFRDVQLAVISGQIRPGTGQDEAAGVINDVVSRFGVTCYGFVGAHSTNNFKLRILDPKWPFSIIINDPEASDIDRTRYESEWAGSEQKAVLDWVEQTHFSEYWDAVRNVTCEYDWRNQGRHLDASISWLRGQVSLSKIIEIVKREYPNRTTVARIGEILCG